MNPLRPSQIAVVTGNAWSTSTSIWRSDDTGATWVRTTTTQDRTVPWWPDTYFSAHASVLAFDPRTDGRLWMGDWFGAWRTEDLDHDPVVWTSRVAGDEETFVYSMVAPPTGPKLMTGVGDVTAFRHDTDVDAYPAMVLTDLKEVYGFGFSWLHPGELVAAGGARSGPFAVRRSSDGGTTWRSAPGYPTGTMPKRVAVSATDPDLFVITRSSLPAVRTEDGGTTFTTITGLPDGMVGPWDVANSLAADPGDGRRFYYFDNQTGGFYRSLDGGKSFARTATMPASVWDGAGVETGSRAGEVYVWADRGGLYRSTTAGLDFTKVANVSRARGFALGRSLTEGGPPTLFLYGALVDGPEGVYRSVDGGDTWTRVDDPARPVPPVTDLLEASWQTFGTLYLGSAGRGVYRGVGI